MLLIHCRAAFMKQVFPRLLSPVRPGMVLSGSGVGQGDMVVAMGG